MANHASCNDIGYGCHLSYLTSRRGIACDSQYISSCHSIHGLEQECVLSWYWAWQSPKSIRATLKETPNMNTYNCKVKDKSPWSDPTWHRQRQSPHPAVLYLASLSAINADYTYEKTVGNGWVHTERPLFFFQRSSRSNPAVSSTPVHHPSFWQLLRLLPTMKLRPILLGLEDHNFTYI